MAKSQYDMLDTLSDGSLIQHGPFNDRIYLMKAVDAASLPQRLIMLAKEKGYGKIFAKLPESQSCSFLEAGFAAEAEIPEFYHRREKGLFLGYYIDAARKAEANVTMYRRNKELALKKQNSPVKPLPKHFTLRPCGDADLERMAEIYRIVFHSYPFPIHNIAYLRKTMKGNVDYYGIEGRAGLIALASAEKNPQARHAEMTDFATIPERRGYGFAVHLLKHMETAMRRQEIFSVFTIARAASPGMNISFAKSNYRFGGRLVNNTNISGRIESMNVWYKHLTPKTSDPC